MWRGRGVSARARPAPDVLSPRVTGRVPPVLVRRLLGGGGAPCLRRWAVPALAAFPALGPLLPGLRCSFPALPVSPSCSPPLAARSRRSRSRSPAPRPLLLLLAPRAPHPPLQRLPLAPCSCSCVPAPRFCCGRVVGFYTVGLRGSRPHGVGTLTAMAASATAVSAGRNLNFELETIFLVVALSLHISFCSS